MCTICLDASPPPMQSGCACRGDGGLAHVECRIKSAVAQEEHRGDEAWMRCLTCTGYFTGPMRTGLAEAWSRVRQQEEEGRERVAVVTNLARPPSLTHTHRHTLATWLCLHTPTLTHRHRHPTRTTHSCAGVW